MHVIAYMPLLCAIIGAFVFALSSNASAKELGRLMFACGLLVTMFALAKHTVHLLPN